MYAGVCVCLRICVCQNKQVCVTAEISFNLPNDDDDDDDSAKGRIKK